MRVVRSTMQWVLAATLVVAGACATSLEPTAEMPSGADLPLAEESVGPTWTKYTSVLEDVTASGGEVKIASEFNKLWAGLRESHAQERAYDYNLTYVAPTHTVRSSVSIDFPDGSAQSATCPLKGGSFTLPGACPYTVSGSGGYVVSAAGSHVYTSASTIPTQSPGYAPETYSAASFAQPVKAPSSSTSSGGGTDDGGGNDETDPATGGTSPVPYEQPSGYDDCVDHYWLYLDTGAIVYRYSTGNCPPQDAELRMANAEAPTSPTAPIPTAPPAPTSSAPVTAHLIQVARLPHGARAAVAGGLQDSAVTVLVTPAVSDYELAIAFETLDAMARRASTHREFALVRALPQRPATPASAVRREHARVLRRILAAGTPRVVPHYGPGSGVTFVHFPAPK